MIGKDQSFTWSEGWWLEGDKAWFVNGMCNILFGVDLNTGECDQVACIPNPEKETESQNPYCTKCGSDIYCIPGIGGSIWIYNLDNKVFTELKVDRPGQHAPGSQFWIWNGSIFIVAANWNKVIEISIDQRKITNYYTICEGDSVRRSVLVCDKIYAVSSESGTIYQFDLSTKKVEMYLHPEMAKKAFAIGFDGEKFWLCGYYQEAYVWDKKNDNLIIVEFSNDFEVHDRNEKINCTVKGPTAPMFGQVAAMGKYIWFIPTMAEKIVYINKETAAICVFDLYEEDKMNISPRKCQGIGNYIIQYIKDNRYIGLFSARNSRILEIDPEQLIYRWKEYYFSERYLQQYCETCKGIYYEGEDLLCTYAYHMNKLTAHYKTNSVDTVGMKIYTKMTGENAR